jgi:aryl-alcohol dehydrogenase-like predicted oxidoreductase
MTGVLRFGDVEVPRIGLGTNRLRTSPANLDLVRTAVAAGIGHIDTAHTYTGGESEETIGGALSPIPEACIVATKGGWGGARPDTLRAEIEESLRRLRTDSTPSTTCTAPTRRRRSKTASPRSRSTTTPGRSGMWASRT